MKRITSVLLIFIIFIAALSGCAGKTDSITTQADTVLEAETTAPEETAAEETEEDEVTADETTAETAAETAPETDAPDEQAEQNAGPAMWVVEDGNGNICYLLGSMHALEEKAFPFRSEIEDAYNECEALAVEIDVIAEEEKAGIDPMAMMDKYFYTDGTTIKDKVPEELYKKMSDILVEYFAPYLAEFPDLAGYDVMSVYDKANVEFWYDMLNEIQLEKAGFDLTLGVDRYFLIKAHEENKEVINIEDVEEHTMLIESFDTSISAALLEELCGDVEEYKKQLQEMAEIYLSGDVDKMLELLEADEEAPEELTDEEKAAYEDYEYKMLTKRNNKMTEAVKSYFGEGKKTFVVVGLAHILGEGGIVDLLTKEGYNVYRK